MHRRCNDSQFRLHLHCHCRKCGGHLRFVNVIIRRTANDHDSDSSVRCAACGCGGWQGHCELDTAAILWRSTVDLVRRYGNSGRGDLLRLALWRLQPIDQDHDLRVHPGWVEQRNAVFLGCCRLEFRRFIPIINRSRGDTYGTRLPSAVRRGRPCERRRRSTRLLDRDFCVSGWWFTDHVVHCDSHAGRRNMRYER